MKLLVLAVKAFIGELDVYDHKSGQHYFADFASVGTNDNFIPLDDDDYEQYPELSGENVSYKIAQDDYQWWQEVCADWQQADDLKQELKEDGVLSEDEIAEIEDSCGGYDLDIQASKRLKAYQKVRDAQKKS